MTKFNGKLIRKNSNQITEINQIQDALKKLGLGQGLTTGLYDSAMESAVKLFQSRNVDAAGYPLKVDGVIGLFTWTALFGIQVFLPPSQTVSILSSQALATAISQIGIVEIPGQPNRGVQVDEYLITAGIGNPAANPPNGYNWCQAFVYWCFVKACGNLNCTNPLPKTAGVLDHWNRASDKRITKSRAQANLNIIHAGMLFVYDHGNNHGHIGFIESIYPDGRFITVEGNTKILTNTDGSGVFRLERRKLIDKELIGFLSY